MLSDGLAWEFFRYCQQARSLLDVNFYNKSLRRQHAVQFFTVLKKVNSSAKLNRDVEKFESDLLLRANVHVPRRWLYSLTKGC